MSVKKKRGLETDPAQEVTSTPSSVEPAAAVAPTGEAAAPEPAAAPADEAAPSQPEQVVDPVPALEARIAELEAALAEARDQLLRKVADFDNTRKRLLRDKEESVKFANAVLLTDLVESIDGLERAIVSAETSRDFDALHEGVVLIERQLMGTLEKKWGLSRMSAAGQPFDPQQHQAVSVGQPAEGDVPVVLSEMQSGYTLNGRVLRPARVIVSATRPAAQDGAGTPEA